ncbi:HD-GYP domain-containing protein [Polynucleobacter rarus]|uniref:HD-GYP domain-containing protein n=1 Tax=Polynucleobacter rarus TaxID=556055 RepID=UPI00131EF15F|nr:HD domain-containing phosphohydrolase [Polynucleobacter rarus]
MNTTTFIYTIFLFFGLFCIGGAVVLFTQFKNDKQTYVTSWIIGLVLLGLATFLVSLKGIIPRFVYYDLGNTLSISSYVYTYYSSQHLLGRNFSFRRIGIEALLAAIAMFGLLNFLENTSNISLQPLIVAILATGFNLITGIAIYKFYKLRQVPFSLALSISFFITAFIWFIRFISISILDVGFAYDGGVINILTFIALMVFGITRFMFFVALVTSLEWGKKEDLITENYLMKIQLANQNTIKTEKQFLETLNSLAKARDGETGNHIIRTQHYVKLLAQRLQSSGTYLEQISNEYIEALFSSAPLHDIGKIGIPDSILLKKGPLTDEEWSIMKTHAFIGESVMDSAKMDIGAGSKVVEIAIKIAGGHHEKWDGSGYPRGLSGQVIPLEARIMALADMYDALVTERPYKKAWTHEKAMAEIISKRGNHFDPAVVDAFIAEQEAFKEVASNFRDD